MARTGANRAPRVQPPADPVRDTLRNPPARPTAADITCANGCETHPDRATGMTRPRNVLAARTDLSQFGPTPMPRRLGSRNAVRSSAHQANPVRGENVYVSEDRSRSAKSADVRWAACRDHHPGSPRTPLGIDSSTGRRR
ncbi:hypothetical protein GCM10023108_49690 [Saccharopolyspora hordei]